MKRRKLKPVHPPELNYAVLEDLYHRMSVEIREAADVIAAHSIKSKELRKSLARLGDVISLFGANLRDLSRTSKKKNS